MTYDDIRRQAELSVRRGCGFALMAIVTAMVGFSGEPRIAVRAGAVFVVIAAVVLFWRGWTARNRNYRRTEVWLMIEDAPALPRERLQTMIGGALAEVYFSHARLAAWVALAMCAISLVIGSPHRAG
jgi:O-antigen/teichoic acid export membrane protein